MSASSGRPLVVFLAILLGAALAVTGCSAGADADRANPAPRDDLHTTLRYGPFVVPPAAASHGQHTHGGGHLGTVRVDVAKPCTDCYVTGFSPGLEYQDGSTANLDTGAMLHHAVWTAAGATDVTCGPGMPGGQRFFATGNERTDGTLPGGYGYYVDDSPWHFAVELMNHTNRPKTLYVTLDVSYRPASWGALKPVTPVWLDIDNCGDSQYSVPAGPSHAVYRWTSTLTGKVVAAAGHLHDGGRRLVLRNQVTDQTLCVSRAGYGGPGYRGHISSMSTCSGSLGTVQKGQVLALHSYYDVPTARDDVMGIMLAYVHQTG